MDNYINKELQKKAFALQDEFNLSAKLIKLGIAEFKNIDFNNNFYFLPFRLISDGLERFMKCYICFKHFEVEDNFPLLGELKTHNLNILKSKIQKSYFKQNNNIQILCDDYEFLSSENNLLNELLLMLSKFGDEKGRYHNLNIVLDSKEAYNVEAEWQIFERRVANEINLSDIQNANYYKEVYIEITAIIEELICALIHQFTYFKSVSQIHFVKPDYSFLRTNSPLRSRRS